MAHPNMMIRSLVTDLGGGLSIWKVHMDCLREQEKNARVMQPRKFGQLSENIKKSGHLESLPYTYNTDPGNTETFFLIISGHHRIRDARAADLTEIYVLNDSKEMSRSEIVAKQLAHNSLNGADDPQMLAALYAEIDDVENKISTGLTEQEIEALAELVKTDNLSLDIEYEIVNIAFVPRDFERFQKILELVEKSSQIYLADKQEFDKFVEQTRNVSTAYNVRNMAGIVAKMIDLLEEQFGLVDPDSRTDWIAVNIGKTKGMVPPEVAKQFDRAFAAAKKLTGSPKFTPNFESIVADFLSGPPGSQ